MSLLKEMYNNYLKVANTIPGFVEGSKEQVSKYDITELANNYCDAVDAHDYIKMNQYISALMIRYWYMIPYMYNKAKGYGFEIVDMSGWLYEGFDKAFKYRGWKDSTNATSREARGAEKCINQAITSVIQGHFKYLYQLKRRNYLTTYSLEAMLENTAFTEDHSNLLSFKEDIAERLDCDTLICSFLDNGKILDAFIVDAICYKDVFTEHSVTKEHTNEYLNEDGELESEVETISSKCYDFSPSKLSHTLRTLSDEEVEDFIDKYDANSYEVHKVYNKIKNYSRVHLAKLIQTAMSKMIANKEVSSFIC